MYCLKIFNVLSNVQYIKNVISVFSVTLITNAMMYFSFLLLTQKNVLFTKAQVWQNEGQQGEVPKEVLGGDDFVEADEHEGLAEHGEGEVVHPVEPGRDRQQQDDLRQEGDQGDARVVILHSQVQQVEIYAEVVPEKIFDVFKEIIYSEKCSIKARPT